MTVKKFDGGSLEAIARVLGEAVTSTTLTNLFSDCGIVDCSRESTKWKRIYHSLIERQQHDGCGNHVAAFIQAVLNPTRFSSSNEIFEGHREELNQILLHCGYELRRDGRLALAKAATSITEAQQRANQLGQKLRDRVIHHDVLKFCKAELLEQNYYHCVLEASKSLAEKVRGMASIAGDGASLVDKAFSVNNPLLALNALQTDSQLSDQKGFAMLLKGIFGTFRNNRAHEPRLHWAEDMQEVLDALTMMSYVHRRLDNVIVVPQPVVRNL
jgi:uncharacterized protein (TIGR02391 family)